MAHRLSRGTMRRPATLPRTRSSAEAADLRIARDYPRLCAIGFRDGVVAALGLARFGAAARCSGAKSRPERTPHRAARVAALGRDGTRRHGRPARVHGRPDADQRRRWPALLLHDRGAEPRPRYELGWAAIGVVHVCVAARGISPLPSSPPLLRSALFLFPLPPSPPSSLLDASPSSP